mgnify:CR=1 FL=1
MPKPTPTLTVTPPSPVLGGAITITGAGLKPGEQVYGGISGYADLRLLTADGQGTVVWDYTGIHLLGTYTFILLRQERRTGNLTLLASVAVTV